MGGKRQYVVKGTTFEVDDRYEVKKGVGQGAYGLICAAKDTASEDQVAIKKISNAFEDAIDCKRMLREMRLLQHFKHENVLCLKDIMMPNGGRIQDWKDVYLVTELLDTDLHYIIHSKQALSDDHIQYFVYQILRGLKAVHSAKVLHRDLKPGNLLVNKNCDLKICDFGLARPVNPDVDAKDMGLTEYVVTRWYRAPELLVENQDYTTAIDVWAVGCIFAEMIGRKALFPGRDYLHQLRLIIDVLGTPSEEDLASIANAQAVQFLRTLPIKPKRSWSEIFPSASEACLDLLSRMLVFNPAKRCSMEDALTCEYMAPLHQQRPLPEQESSFSFDFEKPNVSQEALRELIHAEMLNFHPNSGSEDPK
mmetsp:Transcript_17672/g.44130  ORF Transcript_17672/g.44130 Transcript_17672/m.44130 type:complete len:365 (-) Transcript_17672:163-1257(-)